MANNINQQAINFANNYARTGADDVVSCYLTMKRILAVWNGQSIGNVIPNDSNLIQDGATTATSGVGDGRAPITDGQVNVLISNLTTLVGYFEASSSLMLNQFLQIQVNAQSVVN